MRSDDEGSGTYQTSPLDEGVGDGAAAPQLVVHLRGRQTAQVSTRPLSTAQGVTHVCGDTDQVPDCEQVLPGDGVTARTGTLGHGHRDAQEH